jgi:hypothetical protein
MTTNRAWLGGVILVAAILIGACSSKDSLLNGHGGQGGTNASEGGMSCSNPTPVGDGGGVTCDPIGPCDGGPVYVIDGIVVCSPVQDGAINCSQFPSACDGPGDADVDGNAGAGGSGGNTTGTAGRGGSGGNTAGAGGNTAGAGGRGGVGGVAGSAPGGRGGASGAAGTGSGGTAGGVDGGTDARLCEQGLCTRPYVCVRACGAPAEYTGCCMCDAPLFDDYGGMACGDGGAGAISYVGCRFVGGSNRVIVAKRDTQRNLCVNVVFANGTTPTPGLMLPTFYRLESASVGTASQCPVRDVLATVGGPVTGSATWSGPTDPPDTVSTLDIRVTLPGNDEALIARDIDITTFCP